MYFGSGSWLSFGVVGDPNNTTMCLLKSSDIKSSSSGLTQAAHLYSVNSFLPRLLRLHPTTTPPPPIQPCLTPLSKKQENTKRKEKSLHFLHIDHSSFLFPTSPHYRTILTPQRLPPSHFHSTFLPSLPSTSPTSSLCCTSQLKP